MLADTGAPRASSSSSRAAPAVGGRLVSDPRIRAVSFTGGLVGGRAIAAACADDFTALQLELGGNNPLVVLPDADLADAARAAVDLLTTLNGQWCRALGRLVVPADRRRGRSRSRSSGSPTLHVGDPLDPATDFGPIVHSGHLARLRAAIATRVAAGGTAHTSHAAARRRRQLPRPDPDHRRARRGRGEEIFGPVATVHTYATEDEARRAGQRHAVRPGGLRLRRRHRARAGAWPARSAPARSRSTARRS